MAENLVFEYQVAMRDGIKLYTTVQMPAKKGKFPVVVRRNPYIPGAPDMDFLKNEDTHGYVIVDQQCRGTGLSEGICVPYINERNDGQDLLDWIRKQSFYNGELYLYGGSYTASVHFSYLNTNQPDIKAAFLTVQDTERYNIIYRNGVLKVGLHGNWALGMYKRNQKIRKDYTAETLHTMPLSGVTEHIFGERDDQFEEELLHPDPADPFWQTPAGGSDYHDACNQCNIPIMLVTAFYDIYTEGIFDMWRSLTPERKKQCAFLVTPFSHGWNPPPLKEPSELPDFPGARIPEACPQNPALEYMWFDHVRLGTPLQFIEKGKTTYYTLFENKWHTTETLVNAPVKKVFYLNDDRTLQTQEPEVGEITYTYNPYNPAPFKGGVCNNFGGMQFQDPPNHRYDLLSFLSEPFMERRICNGKMEVKLACRSTAPDTCFYIRLSLVRNGKAIALRDDITTLCHRGKEYIPGTERELVFVFGDHSFEIQPQDQLRLDVSSSCVPHFQVHTNRKGLQALQDKADICRNTCITGRSTLTIFCEE